MIIAPYRFVLLAVLVSTGAAAMVYEVVLIRELSVVLGATEIAASGTLAAFMAGLAIGSQLLGRLGDRVQSPVTLLMLLECGVSTCSLFLMPAVGLIDRVASHPLKVLFSGIVMMIPATLMGGEIPVASKIAITHSGRVGEVAGEVGFAYSADTIGGIVGALSAGLVFLPVLGSMNTMLLGGLLNTVAAASLLFLDDARAPEPGAIHPAQGEQP